MRCTNIRIVDQGPMMVDGPVDITLPDGSHITSDRFMVAICTCRRSKSYPLCDTSHRSRGAAQPTRTSGPVDDETESQK